MRETVGRVPPFGYDRVQQAKTMVAHLAKVTSRRDCKTFSLALTCHFVSIFPRVHQYAVCLVQIPLVFSICTMVSGEPEVVGKPAAFFLVHSPFWSRCGGLGVSQCCFR